MSQHKKISKVNIPMCAAAILFCLTLISIHLTSGLYSKYVTSALGNDSARVITFGDLTLTETGDFYEENKLMIIPGVALNKKAVVDFAGSEAATYVFVEVGSPGWQIASDNTTFSISLNTKTAMQWSIATGWTFLKNDSGTYIYYRELAPNVSLKGTDIIADGKITVSDQITRNEIGSMTGISINLRATVVQSGGFESPEAAWNSIAAKGG